jgi:hypothetical protein
MEHRAFNNPARVPGVPFKRSVSETTSEMKTSRVTGRDW